MKLVSVTQLRRQPDSFPALLPEEALCPVRGASL